MTKKVKKCTNVNIGAPGDDPHCHCEVSAHAGVVTAGNAFGAIRFSFAQADLTDMRKKFMTLRGTDCHVAALLAMTMVDGTLAHGIDNDTMLMNADNHNDYL